MQPPCDQRRTSDTCIIGHMTCMAKMAWVARCMGRTEPHGMRGGEWDCMELMGYWGCMGLHWLHGAA
eukprot:365296-Chlamydomonas_euryale.AAC.9